MERETMNQDSVAPQTQAHKRVDPEPTVHVPSPMSTLPVKFAMDTVSQILETLQPSLAPVVKAIGEKHISLFKTLHRKNQSYTKLIDDKDLIPQSVNIMPSFKLHATRETEETAEYTSILEETNKIIKNFCIQMKEQVM